MAAMAAADDAPREEEGDGSPRVKRARETNGKHQADYEVVAAWWRSDYVEWILNCPKAARGLGTQRNLATEGKRRDDEIEKLKREAEDKAEQTITRGRKRHLATLTMSSLEAEHEMDLAACIKTHSLNDKAARLVFKNNSGKSATMWNAYREIYHRSEVESKTNTGSLKSWDPVFEKFANYKRKDGSVISVADFISSPEVMWSRPSSKQAGKSGYTTYLLDACDDHQQGERTPESMYPTFGNTKGDGDGKGGTPAAPVAWEPVSKELVLKLAPAIRSFETMAKYKLGTYKKALEAYNHVVRAYAQAHGKRSWRINEAAHSGKPRQEPLRAEEPQDIVVSALTSFGEDAAAEVRMIHEELEQLSQIWEQFALTVAGRFAATIDWHNAIVAEMMNTEAMVMCCDCNYCRPSELTFRDVVKDKMSYANAPLREAIEEGLFESVVPKSVPIDGKTPPYQEYTVTGTVYRVYPYAALLTSNKLRLYINFPLMRLCHVDVYNQVAYHLRSWYYAGMVGGGFCNRCLIRSRQNTDDVVFGVKGPWGSTTLAELKPTIERGTHTQHKMWRYRRVRLDEVGLPDTEFPFLAEFRWKRFNIWVVWTKNAFYAEENPGESPRVWAPLPRNEHGDFKPLDWVEGDDHPLWDEKDLPASYQKLYEWECSREYAAVDWEHLLPKTKEPPPPMF